MHINNESVSRKSVAIWVYIGVAMLLIQVIIGGVTRLTGSGLSITEWNVVTGTFPPMNEADWKGEFEKYKTTPQFRLLNMDFTLADFKFIFFWEWFHRFWARLIGIVFVVGFIYLVARRFLKKEMWRPLLILFLLGALQGAVGWIMVASGLTGDALYVKPTRLALHFVFAMGLIAYSFWFALELSVPGKERQYNPSLRNNVLIVLAVLFVQLIYGALMAGHKAASAAPTWPDINGSIVPVNLLREQPLLLNFIDNTITIHFIHRFLAYALLLLIIALTVRLFRAPGRTRFFTLAAYAPLVLVLLQVVLGIVTVLVSPTIVPGNWGTFEWMAQLHQVVGLLLVLSLISLWYLNSAKSFNIQS